MSARLVEKLFVIILLAFVALMFKTKVVDVIGRELEHVTAQVGGPQP